MAGQKNILVTGGAGFIGSHVVDLLICEGHRVVVVDNLSTGRPENLNPEATFYKMDIRDEGLEKVFKNERPEVVIHHAAQVSVRNSVEDPVEDASINILGSLNLLEHSVKGKVKKFIFASTGGAIYGEQEYFPADEGHPQMPVSPYGVAKLSVERYLHFYREVYGLNYVSLRYSNVYGPRQDPYGEAGVVAIFTEKMLSGVQPVINGTGEQTRDFLYVGDAARANLLALREGVSGVFNIGTGRETSINRLFHLLKGLIGDDIGAHHGPPKKGEQFRSSLNPEKAEKIMGWRPEIPIEEGLRLTVESFRRKPRWIL